MGRGAGGNRYALLVALALLGSLSSIVWVGSVFDFGPASSESEAEGSGPPPRTSRPGNATSTATTATTAEASTNGTTPVFAPLRPGDGPATYVPLPPMNGLLPPVSFAGCCGVGHRLARNLPTMVYAVSRGRPLRANWNHDVAWSTLFRDTSVVSEGPAAAEEYMDFPPNWRDHALAHYEPVGPQSKVTAYYRYGEDAKALFEMPLAHTLVRSLSESLTPLVRSFLDPLRAQYAETHLCVHVREGNNETGDWERKAWRHIDLERTLEDALHAMTNYTARRGKGGGVSVFVASDSPRARMWFASRAPNGWHVVTPAREVPRPERGVWFGEMVSMTNAKLSREGLNEAMAEAVADVFALGECDALFVPSYSSFSVVGITLARAERRGVFFDWYKEYVEYPER